MKKVAIIGIVGVPARYGGFETMVENLLDVGISNRVEYTVFCSSKDSSSRLDSYKGARLRYVGLRANGLQSVMYDGVCLLRAVRGYDAVLVLGVSGGIFFPLFRLLSRSRFIVNIDGLEWKRDKWNWLARKFLHFSEKLAVRFSDVVVADNKGIADYVDREYRKPCALIAYGGDHVLEECSAVQSRDILLSYGLEQGEYAIALCRIEPENNCDRILSVFSESKLPLVFIGNWCKSDYGRRLKDRYSKFENIKIVDAIYQSLDLYILRSNCKYYIHGHSAGGTNPSLVEAMYCGCNILAYDVVYNRETTENRACYFKNEAELAALICCGSELCNNSRDMLEIAQRRYFWNRIASDYERLYLGI